MLTNAYLLAKIGADAADNEQHFAEICLIGRSREFGRLPAPAGVAAVLRRAPRQGQRPLGRRVARRAPFSAGFCGPASSTDRWKALHELYTIIPDFVILFMTTFAMLCTISAKNLKITSKNNASSCRIR